MRVLRSSSPWPWLFAAAALLAGAIQLVPHAAGLNPDGVAYLDLAHRLADGEIQDALIGYWSPLLPAILAVVFAIVPVEPPADIPLAFAVVFGTFLFAAAGFRYLLRGLPPHGPPQQRGDLPDRAPERLHRSPPALAHRDQPAFHLAAWSLFVWAALGLVRLTWVGPDMLAAGLAFWAAGAAVRADRSSAGTAVLAGGLWAVAGLAKTAMIPAGAVGVVSTVLAASGPRRALRTGALAAVGWFVILGPYLAGLSARAGHFTIGAAASVNLSYVQGGGRGAEAEPDDPIRVAAVPTTPGITFMHQYDPARFAGRTPDTGSAARSSPERRPRLRLPNLKAQLWILLRNAENYWELASPLLATLFALLLIRPGPGPLSRWRKLAPVWLPALAGLGMYALVWVLGRYVAPFLTLAALAVVVGSDSAGRRGRPAILYGLSIVLLLYALMATVSSLRDSGDSDAAVARALHEAGVAPGEQVAVVGVGSRVSPWLRAARVQVAARVRFPDAARFQRDPTLRPAALEEMAAAGARWVVLRSPGVELGPAWEPVPGSSLWIRPLGPPAPGDGSIDPQPPGG
jgi:hypothetical protein